jgi:hypothetical protein
VPDDEKFSAGAEEAMNRAEQAELAEREAGEHAEQQAGAAADQPPVRCPTEGCPNSAVDVPFVSDQGSAIDLFGKCIGCLQAAGELNEGKVDEIVAEAERRGVVREVGPIQQLTAMVNQLLGEVAGLRREVGCARVGIGALLNLQIGGEANLHPEVLRALGMTVDAVQKAEAAKRGLGIEIATPGVDLRKIRGRLN